MEDWRYRIGSDDWKNLIYKECMAVRRVRGVDETKPVAEPLYADKASELFCVRALSQDLPKDKAARGFWESSSFCYSFLPSHSYLVFQTGRLFLVGAAEEAIKSLENFACADLPHHIVLLTWAESHISGLESLYALFAKEKQEPWLTIWTSSWVWEETLRRLNKRREKHSTNLLNKLLKLNLLTPEEVETDLESEKYDLCDKVVACERQMDIALSLGVRLCMHYVPNALPCLQASFRCNHSQIEFNPLGAIELEEIREEVGKAIHAFPSLQDEFSIRYGKRHVPHPPESYELEGPPVDLSVTNRPLEDVKFETSTRAHASIQPLNIPAVINEEAKAILSKAAVAILCGGLGSKREKELLDPGRRLNIFPDGERTYVLSIIEWRLYQLHLWAREYKVESLPVLLMTSPDTESIVHERVTRFKEKLMLECRYGGQTPLNINYLRQQLVPEVRAKRKAGDEPRLFPEESADGGWILNARGHLDFLRLLCLWASKMPESNRPSLCFVLAYNNLGSLFNEQTLKTLVAFEKAKKHLGVEVFSFDLDQLRSLGREGEPRLDLMSYGVAGDPGLFKNRGYPYKNEKDRQPNIYSSHTWYVNLSEARTIREALEREPLNRYVLIEKEDRLRPRQDMEQATHNHLDVVRIPEKGKGDIERGLYAHSRFLTVRTEDQIRDPQFRKAFNKAIKRDVLGEKFKEEVERDEAYKIFDQAVKEGNLHFLDTAPVEMSYVWGGTTIRTLKELPGRRRVAETWEISTHPAGPSSVYLNLEHPLPLSEVLLKTSGDSHLDFMAKYLDCHDKLSIQVHPSRATAKYLYNHEFKNFKLKDDDGKEESFYVINRATHHDYHLFLGFERENLAPIANHLRPILLEYAGKVGKGDLLECYDRLAQKLCEELKKNCLPEIATALEQKTAPFAGAILASFENSGQEKDEPYLLQNVFRYHVEIGSDLRTGPEHGAVAWPHLSLLGKEYLFAAIGVIRMISLVEEFVKERSGDQTLLRLARALFGQEAEKMSKKEIKKHAPLLKYFHAQEVSTGQWVRVPPGTVHAWQGGGNFLIEVAQCSDNTFRILDFGRELSESTKRDMHHLAAMYALSADSILDEESSKRFLIKAEVTGTAPKPFQHYHSELKCRLFGAGTASRIGTACEPLQDPGWSVVMNPDNPVRIRTDSRKTEEGRAFSEISLGRCRAVLIRPGTRFRLVPAHPDDRFLYISPRVERTDLVCISLGATKLEVALYRDGESPPIIWSKGKHPGQDESGARYLEKLIEVACACIKNMLRSDAKQRAGKQRRNLRVAVSWPGYVKRMEGARAELYSSAFHEVELDSFGSHLLNRIKQSVRGTYSLREQSESNPLIMNDAAASALGEYRHPLGWMVEDAAGMTLNIGSGLCFGFYPGTSKAAGEEHEDEEARPKQTQEEERRKDAERLKTEEERRTRDACAAVGRWLYIDPRTGRMGHPFQVPLEQLPGAIQNHVFQGLVPARAGHRLRTSLYLSSRGIALRFLSRLPDPKDFAAKAGWNIEKLSQITCQDDTDRLDLFLEGCEVIAAHPNDFDFHRMIHQINVEAANERSENSILARELIIEVAQELAEVIRQTVQMIEMIAPPYTDCIKRVVLTGTVGEHFGRISADDWLFGAPGAQSSSNVVDKDLLIGIMTRCLSSAGLKQQPEKVRRSEISISSIREIEGFLHYLATQPDFGGGIKK
jgi:mannose-6-phosphate isomerase class I